MTMISQPAEAPPSPARSRSFPSGIVLFAALELILIAALLRAANTQIFFPAVCACGLCSFQLGILLINRFSINTRNVRRLARSAEFSDQPTFITDPKGRIKWTNPKFSRLTSYGLAEVVGKTFSMVLHGQETDTRTVEMIRGKMHKMQPFDAEVLQYDRTGMSQWVSTKGEPVFDASGVLTHYVVTQLDITEERRQSQGIIDGLTRGTAAVPISGISTERVVELTRQLESLGATDERELLQQAVDGLKNGLNQTLAIAPAARVESNAQVPVENKIAE